MAHRKADLYFVILATWCIKLTKEFKYWMWKFIALQRPFIPLPAVWPLLDINPAPFAVAAETTETGRMPGTIFCFQMVFVLFFFFLLPDEDPGILLTGIPDLAEHFAQPKKRKKKTKTQTQTHSHFPSCVLFVEVIPPSSWGSSCESTWVLCRG